MTEEERYWVAFSVFPGIGPVRFELLKTHFGSAKEAYTASQEALMQTNLPHDLVDSFCSFRSSFSISSYEEELRAGDVHAITKEHPKYPRLLKEIDDAPIVLYVKGKPSYRQKEDQLVVDPIDMERTIAVVGTRHPTPYGVLVTKQIVTDLVGSGCTIVSGMAYGIDAVAHETAIARNGKTIAVVGCGVDICAPRANLHIYEKLTGQGYGAVVSEMPLGLRPSKLLFPVRNRIISGLSLGTVVIEGADDSGTLITARNAGEQGRDVFAIPGPITSTMSKGPAKLIKAGASLVETADDILSLLGLAKRHPIGEQ